MVYYEQQFDLSKTLPYLDRWNRDNNDHLSVFDIVVAACGKVLHMRPGLNRFVSGGRIYQRSRVEVAFAAKKFFDDTAPLVTIKLPMFENESLGLTSQRIRDCLREARGERDRPIDREVRWVTRLPGFVLRGAVKLANVAGAWNLLPAAFTADDPMFSSVFLANLGSVGIDNAYHHLYEYGTASLFGVFGRVKKVTSFDDAGTPRVHDAATVRWTFDERINDGFYCAKTLELLRSYVEDPSLFPQPIPD